jgi:hypothetical protein
MNSCTSSRRFLCNSLPPSSTYMIVYSSVHNRHQSEDGLYDLITIYLKVQTWSRGTLRMHSWGRAAPDVLQCDLDEVLKNTVVKFVRLALNDWLHG